MNGEAGSTISLAALLCMRKLLPRTTNLESNVGRHDNMRKSSTAEDFSRNVGVSFLKQEIM